MDPVERTLKRRALVILIAMIIVFSAYGYYLFVVKVERRPVLYTSVDFDQPVLDELNKTALLDMFNRPEFLLNYTLDSPPEYGIVKLYPNHNPDVVFVFSNSSGDIYINVDGYMKVGALGVTESYSTLEDEIITEINLLLDRMGYGSQTSYQGWDDYDFATWPEEHHVIGFFGFAAFIITYAFAMEYRQGWILTGRRSLKESIELMAGMFMIYSGTVIGLLLFVYIILNWFYDLFVCLAVPAVLLPSGFYYVTNVAKKAA